MFKRVLVANRGEIALRIIRACHEEGLEAVAVYSEADRLSPHVPAADAAVPLGAPPAAQSYPNIPKLIPAPRATHCPAPHPGHRLLPPPGPVADAGPPPGLGCVRPPARARSTSRSISSARGTSRCRSSPTRMGASSP